jgi:hypothetical protein
METLLSGLILAAVSGLTFLAYQHPNGYARLQWPLRICMFLLLAVGGAWDTAAERTMSLLAPMLAPGQFGPARAALSEVKILAGWTFTGIAALYLYSEILGFLPQILGREKPSRD